jgi:glutathione S-transferase
MVSVPVSPYCELARWILDRLGVPYVEDCHVPGLHLVAARRHGGGAVVPVLDIGAESLTDARQVVDYYDRRAPEALRLYPEEASEARQVFDEVFNTLGVAVRAWAYAYMLPRRASTAKAWVDRAPQLECRIVAIAYPLLAALVRSNLRLQTDSVPIQRAIIDASLANLDARLGDGRPYLLGDRLTAPDLALAALLAPAILPAEYRGPLPELDELPEPMRQEVEQFRVRPTGELALRLYREERHGREPASGP